MKITLKNISVLNFKKLNGLIPAIIEDSNTNQVLMLGFMNREALQKTFKDKKVTFYSRTKKRLWQKGEESKNFLMVKSVLSDCDNDTLLIKADPAGPTCHTGNYSCFSNKSTFLTKKQKSSLNILIDLFKVIKSRKKSDPKKSYTAFLFKKGLNKINNKIGEESREVIKAAKKETKQRLIEESSDLLYHLFVLLALKEIELKDIAEELSKRRKK